MKRERKAFVYIVNAPSETKKIKVKKRMSELVNEEGLEDLS